MRTERLRGLVRAIVPAAALAAPGLVRAADVTFEPTLDANAFYDGNVHGVGETDDPALSDPSAVVGGVGMTLPWTVRTPSSAFAFTYRPRREVYGDDARPDFTSHSLNGSYSKTMSPRSSYAFNFDYDRSDRQELNPLRPSDALTYLPRRTFQSGGVGANGSFSAGRRSSLNWRVGARLDRGEDLPDSPFEDSESYDGAFAWAMNYSEQGTAGIGVSVQHFAYEVGSGVDVVSFGHTGSRRFSREGSMSYAVGALRSDDGEQVDYAGSVNLAASWTLGPHSSLSCGVRQGASAGDGASGASLDRGGYLTWGYHRPRGFGASVSAGYWDRSNLNDDPLAPQPPSAFTLSDSVSWSLGRFFRFGLFHSYHNQSSDPSDPSLETSYHTAGMSWTWILRGTRGGGA